MKQNTSAEKKSKPTNGAANKTEKAPPPAIAETKPPVEEKKESDVITEEETFTDHGVPPDVKAPEAAVQKPESKETKPPTATTFNKKEVVAEKQEEKPIPSEMVVREIMIQKNVSRERAIEILQNPKA